MKKYYRVCNKETLQGLWYTINGSFTGFIHDKFSFCLNTELKMDFDVELVGWLSATDNLEDLFNWFTKEDIVELQKHGWYIHEFEATEVKFYERFQHLIINQNTSKVLRVINIEETIEYITHMLTMDNVLYAQPTYPIGSDGRSRYESGLRCVNSTIKYQESISYSKEELKIIIDKTIDKFYKHNFR
jgi:hypothetical protein